MFIVVFILDCRFEILYNKNIFTKMFSFYCVEGLGEGWGREEDYLLLLSLPASFPKPWPILKLTFGGREGDRSSESRGDLQP